jgi:c-di-GMP-binding flagellar brake protein YcgR
MKLRVEDRLQLEPPAQLSRERLLVKVIGFMRGVSLLVTTPAMSNGQRIQLLEGEKVIMRSFSGKNAFAFACNVIRVNKLPFEYLHLSFPDNIQGLAIRKTARVKTRIITTVQNSKSGEEQTSAIISDISATGVSLDSRRPLGEKGDVLSLAFRVNLHSIEAFMSVKGVIRAVLNEDTTDDLAKSEHIRYGIELQNLQPNDSVILQSMIYQQMIENPQKLV